MDRLPDVLQGRLEQIAYPHIRDRLEQLKDDPQGMLDYINGLLLDTRDGTRRGFDLTTADALMSIKVDLLIRLGELERLGGHTLLPDSEFSAAPGKPVNGYTKVPLPKNW
ncbi:hypothetical protein Tther_00886 [Tepidimonas thermarum]|uniref:Uncharacterized protein n=1 Tax=Tepidimonas thermarum TaxID=335431 RepID=A0A554X4G9_9BURK|nr:hypothetical protein [Tepidimonas thermarum]TSE30646.1 hypothetical protein Tther_00886 [Tepidimonas thermarum]